jgi:hypothetical protein
LESEIDADNPWPHCSNGMDMSMTSWSWRNWDYSMTECCTGTTCAQKCLGLLVTQIGRFSRIADSHLKFDVRRLTRTAIHTGPNHFMI